MKAALATESSVPPSVPPFAPPFWARSAFVQTALAGVPRTSERAPFVRRLPTADGDFVRLHEWRGPASAPLVLLLHGLEGGASSRYVGEFARRVREVGWSLTLLEFRSCGEEPNQTERFYHSGETSDLAWVVEHLRREAPERPWFACGFSLGGNVLLKWLGEVGERAPMQLRAAAAVSAPFDLAAAARRCDSRWGGVIARHFLRTLVPKALEKARRFPGRIDAEAVRRCRSFAEFDDLVTAPLHGFVDAEDYWTRSSCAQFLPAVRVPTLLLSAADDPLVPEAVLPRAVVASSPWLIARFSARGGHCGFVDGGSPWRPRRWAEAQVMQFFAGQVQTALTPSRATAGTPR